jgi:hypothetical protein
MTTTATTHPAARTSGPLLPAAVFLGTTAFTALGVFGDGTSGAEPDLGEFFVIVGVGAVAVAVVFGLVVPRTLGGTKSAGVGLGLSIAGLLLIVAFWSGLTPTLAVGGMVLGAAARRSGRRTGMGGVAVAIGALAMLGYVSSYVGDWMATNNIAGM